MSNYRWNRHFWREWDSELLTFTISRMEDEMADVKSMMAIGTDRMMKLSFWRKLAWWWACLKRGKFFYWYLNSKKFRLHVSPILSTYLSLHSPCPDDDDVALRHLCSFVIRAAEEVWLFCEWESFAWVTYSERKEWEIGWIRKRRKVRGEGKLKEKESWGERELEEATQFLWKLFNSSNKLFQFSSSHFFLLHQVE